MPLGRCVLVEKALRDRVSGTTVTVAAAAEARRIELVLKPGILLELRASIRGVCNSRRDMLEVVIKEVPINCGWDTSTGLGDSSIEKRERRKVLLENHTQETNNGVIGIFLDHVIKLEFW